MHHADKKGEPMTKQKGRKRSQEEIEYFDARWPQTRRWCLIYMPLWGLILSVLAVMLRDWISTWPQIFQTFGPAIFILISILSVGWIEEMINPALKRDRALEKRHRPYGDTYVTGRYRRPVSFGTAGAGAGLGVWTFLNVIPNGHSRLVDVVPLGAVVFLYICTAIVSYFWAFFTLPATMRWIERNSRRTLLVLNGIWRRATSRFL